MVRFVRRQPTSTWAERRVHLVKVARFWGFAMPFGVAAIVTATLVPAAMFMQGTEMGDRFRRVRARAFGSLGVVDPWAVSLHEINLDQERFKRLAASLPPRPVMPNSSVLESLPADEIARLRRDYVVAAVLRDRTIKQDARATVASQFAAERNRSRVVAYTARKNDMIVRATSKSELQSDPKRGLADD